MRSMEAYPRAAMERAMKVQDVMLQAMAKKITWWQAAEILGISDRHMRRIRERYEEEGYNGLLDRRRGPPPIGCRRWRRRSGGGRRRRYWASATGTCGGFGSATRKRVTTGCWTGGGASPRAAGCRWRRWRRYSRCTGKNISI